MSPIQRVVMFLVVVVIILITYVLQYNGVIQNSHFYLITIITLIVYFSAVILDERRLSRQ